MDPSEEVPPRRRIALLPLVLFAALIAYFAWRFWESGERIHLLLAAVNAMGLVMVLRAWQQPPQPPISP